MHMRRDGAWCEVPHDLHAQRRRDIARGRTGFEDVPSLVLSVGAKRSREHGLSDESKEEAFHKIPLHTPLRRRFSRSVLPRSGKTQRLLRMQ
jgi:hypothetical protein